MSDSREEPIIPTDGGINIMIGSPRTGKTGLAARAVNWHVLNENRRAVILDPTGDVMNWLQLAYRVPADECATVQTSEECWKALEGGPGDLWYGKSIVSFRNPDRLEVSRLSEQWLEVVNCRTRKSGPFRDGSKGFVFLCDEAELVFPNNRLDDRRMTAAKLAGNFKHTIYLTSQYPQILSAYVRGLAFEVCVFNSGANELFIENGCKVWGKKESFEASAALKKFHYQHRPKYRADPAAELTEYHSMDDPIPWLELESETEENG